jgi:hypothetical protein
MGLGARVSWRRSALWSRVPCASLEYGVKIWGGHDRQATTYSPCLALPWEPCPQRGWAAAQSALSCAAASPSCAEKAEHESSTPSANRTKLSDWNRSGDGLTGVAFAGVAGGH